MTFANEIKKEIISKKMNKEEQLAFLNGVVFSLLKKDNSTNLIKIIIKDKNLLESLEAIAKSLKINFESNGKSITFQDFKVENIKAKNAPYYLSGIFLNSGSISKLDSSSYHLQISFKDEECATELKDFAAKHVIFNQTKNKNNFILYLKKHEYISDFLYIIGAKESYFKFIDSVIERDHRNQITRISNLDVHNQEKLVDSHQLFLENLEYIEKFALWHKFNNEQILFYKIKAKNPFLPLSQLAELLEQETQIKKSKSGLNHWLMKLRKVCEDHEYILFKIKKEKLV